MDEKAKPPDTGPPADKPKTIEYIILKDHKPEDLVVKVMDHIKDGWEPLGGVAGVYDGGHLRVGQAMVRTIEVQQIQ